MAQKVFVAELAGMHLNGDVAGQLAIELLIHFNDLFRGDRFCEINLGFHENFTGQFGVFTGFASRMFKKSFLPELSAVK